MKMLNQLNRIAMPRKCFVKAWLILMDNVKSSSVHVLDPLNLFDVVLTVVVVSSRGSYK